MSDLDTLRDMLDRCRVRHEDFTSSGVTEVHVSPDNPNWDTTYADCPAPSLNVTGDHWVSVTFRFLPGGQLSGINMTGD